MGSDTEKEDSLHEEDSDVVEADSLDEEESDEERPNRTRKPKPFFTYDELGKPKVSRLRSILKKTDGEREKNSVSNGGAPPDNSEYEPPHNSLKSILKKKTSIKTKRKQNVHVSINEAPPNNSNIEPHDSLSKKQLAILKIPRKKEKHVRFISKITANLQTEENLRPGPTITAHVSTCLFPEKDHQPQNTNFNSSMYHYPTAYPYYYPYSHPQFQPIYRYPHILQPPQYQTVPIQTQF